MCPVFTLPSNRGSRQRMAVYAATNRKDYPLDVSIAPAGSAPSRPSPQPSVWWPRPTCCKSWDTRKPYDPPQRQFVPVSGLRYAGAGLEWPYASLFRHSSSILSGRHKISELARSLSSFAPLPLQALPCMQASVVGSVEANRSSIARVFLVCEK